MGALLGGGATSAMAATITGTAAAPVWTAADGVSNALTVTQNGDVTTFADPNDAITDAGPCTLALNGTDADCDSAGNAAAITVNLGNGDFDSLSSNLTTVPITANGGDGQDDLRGGDGDDHLNGEAGSDSLFGGVGGDDLTGGADQDIASVQGPPVDLTVSLNDLVGDGEAGDNIHSDVESVVTEGGNDHIIGSGVGNGLAGFGGNDNIEGLGGDDLIVGGDGDDTIDGGAGNDTIDGDDAGADPNLPAPTGNDVINARDGSADIIDCGPGGNDVANVDEASIDSNIANCETINRPPPPVVITDPPPTGGGGAGAGAVTSNPATTTTAAANTSASTPTVTPALKTPTGLTAKLKSSRDRSRPYSFTISGKLSLPAGVTKAAGCKGTVKLTGKRGTKTVVTKSATLKSDCSYSIKASVKTKGQVKMTVRFDGNSVLKGKNAATRIARAG
ncbi:MAG TPA: hypothetical protein VMY78_10455 [Solirubrobacteraceae bacterium]|nr:hypothetical protein [Solirubrobacteraceae bacterium]